MFGSTFAADWTQGTSVPPVQSIAHGGSVAASVQIKKQDDEQQLVYGEVYAPGFPDSQGDFMTVETIQEMAHGFMRKGLVTKIDVQHSQQESGCYVVESFIAREGDLTFIPGSWVLGVKVPDPEIWSLVKSGELNGFSLDGFGVRVETVLEIDMPDLLQGETLEVEGHRHRFFVKFDRDGNFLGGHTDVVDGHMHRILRGTVTEDAFGHAHRFSFVEGVLSAQV
ncbi:MAG: XkdF-like putative serine protease domain-containing protein [Aquamicrobium sp.]|uniref:XkdF-like putative serine protease domain-containing protein n=1 Tax=Aquamicrobium sp. TaxID=1872579 RepID=UPI00349EB107|nr:XkdF-like putative serine protease domain-containing protein [Aquamicrobium sp.]